MLKRPVCSQGQDEFPNRGRAAADRRLVGGQKTRRYPPQPFNADQEASRAARGQGRERASSQCAGPASRTWGSGIPGSA